MSYTRYAIYYTAPPGPLAEHAAAWLGWDIASGEPRAHPKLDGLPLSAEAATATPRKYGFHGTLKAPFRLAHGADEAGLRKAVSNLAGTRPPCALDALTVAELGNIIALRPTGDVSPLAELAAACVKELDAFRAPLSPEDLAKRRRGKLSPRQDALLVEWGYPYILDEFRFHMTLTGALRDGVRDATRMVLEAQFADLLSTPFVIDAISLCGERPDGHFEEINRASLIGP